MRYRSAIFYGSVRGPAEQRGPGGAGRWVRVRRGSLLWLAVALTAAAFAQGNPKWEVRTYVGPADPAGVYTDRTGSATWQYNLSKVRGRWVCPRCGFSSPVVQDPANPPECPNPWLVPGHESVSLRYQPVSRCFISTTDRPVDDPSGHRVRALVGKPFHPTTPGATPDDTGSTVHIAVAGLHNNKNVTAGDSTGDFVRFLVLMPGAKFPAARVTIGSTNELGLNTDNIHVNPLRVTDGEVFHVQLWEYFHPGTSESRSVVRVYSSLDGLIFFGYYEKTGVAGGIGVGAVTVIAATGAVAIDIPDLDPPAGVEAEQSWVTEFTVHSNTTIIPGPQEDPTADPPDFSQVPDSNGNGITDWRETPPILGGNNWPLKRNFFRIPANGRVADWLTPVIGSGHPVQRPYLIPPGAVGKGQVVVLWQRRQACEGKPPGSPYSGVIDDPTDNQGPSVIDGKRWWWEQESPSGPGVEWNYDWLTESDRPATYTHLWGNSSAVIGRIDLTDWHTPLDVPNHFRTGDPPWFMATYFVSSRLQIPPTGNTWRHGSTTEPAELDADANGGHAVVVVGEVSGNEVSGAYEAGTRTVTRWAAFRNRQVMAFKCPNCGSTVVPDAGGPPTSCPYCGTALDASRRLDGYCVVFPDVDVPPGQDLDASPRTAGRQHVSVPDSCLEMGPHGGWYGPASASSFWVAFDLPAYLPPSVPAGSNPAVNNLDADQGYRGRLLLFHRPVGIEVGYDYTGRGGHLAYNWRWDATYRCPACGAWQNQSGACANDGSQPGTTACAGTKICRTCGVAYGPNATTCPVCGSDLFAWTRTATFCGQLRVGPEDLDCEEYEPFEVVVSVLRKLELGSKVAGLDLGRVAPGVPTQQPDTTTPATAAKPEPEPEPSDVSPAVATALVNEGNVGAAAALRGTHLHRSDVDPDSLSYPAQAARNPVTLGTMFAARVDGSQITDAAPLASPIQEPGGAEGFAATALMSAGWLLPGVSYKPVPLGQATGIHTGLALFFQDLNGNGALDFYDRSAGEVTNTNAAVFDPLADLPLEPVGSFDLRLRVAESGFVDNDYFAADFAPSLSFRAGAGGADALQIVFGSNRPPGAAVGAAGQHYTAPPANDAEARARAAQPINLFYSSADVVPDPTDYLYRRYVWRTAGGGGLEPGHTLTASSTTGAVNGAPDAFHDGTQWWALWHRATPTATGVESTLRYNRSGSLDYTGSGEGFMFTGRHLAGLRSLMYGNAIWLFWHAGQRGQEQVYYLPNFNPAAPRDGSLLALSNNFGSQPHQEQAIVYLSGDAVDSVMAHRPSEGPFVYTKDPCPWVVGEYVSSGPPDVVVNVVFSGYVRHEENADLCWVKFRLPDLADPARAAQPTVNWGKKAFPRLSRRLEIPLTRTNPSDPGTGIWVGEELEADARRSTFAARHLDWVVHDKGPGDNFGRAPDPNQQDPIFYLAVVTDVIGDGAPPTVSVYRVTWAHSDDRWNRARSAYFVEPRFELLRGPDVLAPRAFPGDPSPYRLVDPATVAQATPQPLIMEIAPAAGRVRFSAPLFNREHPADNSTVCDRHLLANVTDVQLYADYTPLIWRLTRDPADDDCPWAYWNSNENGYLAFFWRRSYSLADAPHWGRSVFLYKLWAPSVQLCRPPLSGSPTVQWYNPDRGRWEDLPASEYDLYPRSGVIVLRRMRVDSLPRRLRVSYTGAGGVAVPQEEHAAIGWSQERRIAVETELPTGPLVVRPEAYRAFYGPGNDDWVPAVRFWLAWTSPRTLLDLRPAASGGGSLRQSADIYTATVLPELNAAVAEPVLCSISADPT
jgi:uncharacterized OB-fold protein